jgi:hypothetical protein
MGLMMNVDKFITPFKQNNFLDFPIHIELNAFASSGFHDLLDFASTRWDDRYGFPKAEAHAYKEPVIICWSAFQDEIGNFHLDTLMVYF